MVHEKIFDYLALDEIQRKKLSKTREILCSQDNNSAGFKKVFWITSQVDMLFLWIYD